MYLVSLADTNGKKHIVNLDEVLVITEGTRENHYVVYCKDNVSFPIGKKLFHKLFNADFVDDEINLDDEDIEEDEDDDKDFFTAPFWND